MADQVVVLMCKKVKFYSGLDEEFFFEWIEKISRISEVKGVADTICLYVVNKRISDEDFRNLIILFYRYRISLKPLEVFLTKNNEHIYYEFRSTYHINMYPAHG